VKKLYPRLFIPAGMITRARAEATNRREHVPPPTPFRTGPGPGGIYATLNIRVACNTTGFATSDFLTLQVPDGWNGIDTIVTLASNSGANSNYYNENRIVLYGSYKSNFGNGNYGSSILFQSQIQEQHGKQILILSF
jgi:hypothetical protein